MTIKNIIKNTNKIILKIKKSLYFLDDETKEHVMQDYYDQISEMFKQDYTEKEVLEKIDIEKISLEARAKFSSHTIKLSNAKKNSNVIFQILALPWIWIFFLPVFILFVTFICISIGSPAIFFFSFISFSIFDFWRATALVYGGLFSTVLLFIISFFIMAATWVPTKSLIVWTIQIFKPTSKVAMKIKKFSFFKLFSRLPNYYKAVIFAILFALAAISIPANFSTKSTLYGSIVRNNYFHNQEITIIDKDWISIDNIDYSNIIAPGNIETLKFVIDGFFAVDFSKSTIDAKNTPDVDSVLNITRSYNTKKDNKYSITTSYNQNKNEFDIKANLDWQFYLFGINEIIHIDTLPYYENSFSPWQK